MISDATFSARARLRARKDDLGISVAFLATLIGTSKNRLNEYFVGNLRFSTQEENALLEITNQLLDFKEALAPFCLPLSDGATAKALLKHLEGTTPERVRAIVGLILAEQ